MNKRRDPFSDNPFKYWDDPIRSEEERFLAANPDWKQKSKRRVPSHKGVYTLFAFSTFFGGLGGAFVGWIHYNFFVINSFEEPVDRADERIAVFVGGYFGAALVYPLLALVFGWWWSRVDSLWQHVGFLFCILFGGLSGFISLELLYQNTWAYWIILIALGPGIATIIGLVLLWGMVRVIEYSGLYQQLLLD